MMKSSKGENGLIKEKNELQQSIPLVSTILYKFLIVDVNVGKLLYLYIYIIYIFC